MCSQISTFKISAKSVRTDSTPIGSNIARYSRFELIHNTLRKFIAGLGETGMLRLNHKLRNMTAAFLQEDAKKMVYRLNTQTPEQRIAQLGDLIYRILKRLDPNTFGYELLHSVFHEQYGLSKKNPCFVPRKKYRQKAFRITTAPMPITEKKRPKDKGLQRKHYRNLSR